MMEHHAHQQPQLVKLAGQRNVECVELEPVRLESSLPDCEEGEVGEDEGGESDHEKKEEAVGRVVVAADTIIQYFERAPASMVR